MIGISSSALQLLFVAFVAATSSAAPCAFTTPADGAILSSGGGIIKSDADGVGTGSSTPGNMRCQWEIRCPLSSQVMAVTHMHAHVSRDDSLSFYDRNAQALFVNFTGHSYYHQSFMTQASSMQVIFQTSSSSTRTGVEFDYKCFDTPCSSLTTPQGSLSNTSGVIMSDIDGAGKDHDYILHERCEWEISCPAPYQGILFYPVVARTSRSSEYISFFVTSTGTEVSRLYESSAVAAFVASSPTITVFFDTTQSSEAIPFYSYGEPSRYGFTVSYTCLESPSCASPNATTSVFQQSSGFLQINMPDGSGYADRESCFWQVVCPSESDYLFFSSIVGRTASSSDTLKVTTASETRVFNYGVSTAFAVGQLAANLTFESSAHSRGPGLNVTWDCRQSRCSSANATSEIVHGPARIMTDTDGAGTNYFVAETEVCSWKLQCPPSTAILVSRVVGFLAVGVSAVLRKHSEDEILRLSGAFDEAHLLRGVWNVTLSLNATSVGSDGFTLDFECVPELATCLSPTDTAAPVTEQGPEGNGTATVLSHAGGHNGGIPYASGQTCHWTLTCTAGSEVAINGVYGAFSGDSLRVLNSVTQDVIHEFNGNYSSARAIGGLFTHQREVSLVFTSLAVSLSAGFKRGWMLAFTCVAESSICSSSSSPVGNYYPIVSDYDGAASMFYPLQGENCNWAHSCSPGEFVFTGSAVARVNSPSALKLIDPTTEATLMTYMGDVTPALFRVTTAKVVYKPIGAPSAGFTLPIGCTVRGCAGPNSSRTGETIVISGEPYQNTITLLTDPDGSSNEHNYVNSISCWWIVKCEIPVLMVFFSSVVGITRNSDKVTFDGSAGGGTTYRKSGSFSAHTTYLADTNAVNLSLGFASGGTDSGLTIRATCVQSLCTSPNATGSTFTNDSGVIMTGSPYLAQEQCRWVIACPDGRGYGFVKLRRIGPSFSGNNNDRFTVYTGANDEEVQESPTVASASSYLIRLFAANPPSMTLTFRSFLGQSRGNDAVGYEYTCAMADAICSSPNGTGVVISALAGSLLTDADGFGSDDHTYVNQACEWTIRCPSGYNFISFSGTPSGKSSRFRLFDPVSSTSRTYVDNSESFFFTGSEVKLSSEYASRNGFEVEYQCLQRQCSASDAGQVFSGTSGTIAVTHPNIDYFGFEDCTWTVRCPNGHSVSIYGSGSRYNSSDILLYIDAETGEHLQSYTSGTVVLSPSAVTIRFIARSGRSRRGYTLNWQCVSKVTQYNPSSMGDCGSTPSEMVDANHGLFTINNAMYEGCTIAMHCPHTSSMMAVAVTGTTGSSSSSSRMSLVDPNGRLLGSDYSSVRLYRFTRFSRMYVEFGETSYTPVVTVSFICLPVSPTAELVDDKLDAVSGTATLPIYQTMAGDMVAPAYCYKYASNTRFYEVKRLQVSYVPMLGDYMRITDSESGQDVFFANTTVNNVYVASSLYPRLLMVHVHSARPGATGRVLLECKYVRTDDDDNGSQRSGVVTALLLVGLFLSM